MSGRNAFARLLPALLILLSLVMLLFNSIVTYGDTKYDWSEYRENIDDVMDEVSLYSGLLLGNSIDLNELRSTLHYLEDGKLTSLELFKLCHNGRSLLSAILSAAKDMGFDSDIPSEVVVARLLLLLFELLFLAVIFMGVIVLVLRVLGRYKALEKAYSVSQMLLLLAFILLTIFAKQEPLVLSLRITAAPVLAVLFALPMPLLARLPIPGGAAEPRGRPRRAAAHAADASRRTAERAGDTVKKTAERAGEAFNDVKKAAESVLEVWVCGRCGSKNRKSFNYCPSCGSSRPEPSVCPHCGADISSADSVCGACGRPLKRANLRLVCSACGCTSDADSCFCEHCGTRFSR